MWSDLRTRAQGLPLLRFFFPTQLGVMDNDGVTVQRTSRPDAEGKYTDRWEGTLYLYGRLVITRQAVDAVIDATPDEREAFGKLDALLRAEAEQLINDFLLSLARYQRAKHEAVEGRHPWRHLAEGDADLLGRPLP